jgi:hypothetical protein
MGLFAAILIARILRVLTRLRGGGSAFPGLVLLRLVPNILGRTLGALSEGVIFVTGSNGKSTTTTMLVSVLRAHGLRVFTNPAGGNLPQGLASAIVPRANLKGRIDADIAVLEVDEAYGTRIASLLRPDWVLITNLQVDQLNRFGEPENVYRMMTELAGMAKQGVVVNEGDPNLVALGAGIAKRGTTVVSAGVSVEALESQAHGLVPAGLIFDDAAVLIAPPKALLKSLDTNSALIHLGAHELTIALPAAGLHYGVDAALAIAMASVVLGDSVDPGAVQGSFLDQPPVYGRGEIIRYRNRDIALTMMKNQPSLQVNLAAMTGPLERVWIAVDEGTPDPSWIFDVDLAPIDHVDILTGTKAWQWALLLEFRDIPYGAVIEDTQQALDAIVALSAETEQPVHAIINYEQMMLIRRLAGYKDLEGGQ